MKIFDIIAKIWAFFHKAPAKPARVLVSTRVETVDGKKIQITTYNDGSIERKEINENDPTDVGGFINNLPR